ncbi:MAG: hypothetical protein ILP09_08560 [Oscillospiraceae bacterium]|nr:hypothetical protein [Oscillospiraceae bacterium]
MNIIHFIPFSLPPEGLERGLYGKTENRRKKDEDEKTAFYRGSMVTMPEKTG